MNTDVPIISKQGLEKISITFGTPKSHAKHDGLYLELFYSVDGVLESFETEHCKLLHQL